MILGETEWLYVEEANGNFMSRVDTGATTSSISAQDVTVFEREGRRWVKFTMPVDGENQLMSKHLSLNTSVFVRPMVWKIVRLFV